MGSQEGPSGPSCREGMDIVRVQTVDPVGHASGRAFGRATGEPLETVQEVERLAEITPGEGSMR